MLKHQNADGRREFETARSAGTGIEIENALLVLYLCSVRVAVEDDGEFCCGGVEVQRADIVQQVEVVTFEEKHFGFRQTAGRAFAIDVAAHGMDRSNARERFEDGGVADITEVKDVFDTLERGKYFRAQQTVGIADDADLHRLKLRIWDQIPF